MPEKNPWEWEKADIEQMIVAQKQEDINLDYKASDSLDKTEGKKKEISKDVSAFANSDGGVIIYGVKENPSQRDLPEKIDSGVDPANITKEWLEQVVNSTIKPRLQGLRIRQIPIGSGRVIYVVYIPKSTTVHQASDGRYYKRYNFQSIVMEHYEVLDVLNRGDRADLEPEFFFVPAGTTLHLVVLLKNQGKRSIKDFRLELSLPSGLITNCKGESTKIINYRGLSNTPGEKAYEFFDLTFSKENGDNVIFPTEELRFIDPNGKRLISISRSTTNEPMLFMKGPIIWQLYADDMPVKNGMPKIFELRVLA